MNMPLKMLATTAFTFALNGSAVNAGSQALCTVTNTTGNGVTVLSFSAGPAVGETVEIDTSLEEITTLDFSDGGQIPLKDVGAKLVRVGLASEFGTTFEGRHSTARNEYIGVLQVVNKAGPGLLQVLRKRKLGRMDLLTINLSCIEK